MKDANFAKTLDGNYDDKIAVGSSRKADELDGIFQLPVGEQGEAMKHYESKSALCPFYHSEEARAIHCEGTEDNNVLHLIFGRRRANRNTRSDFAVLLLQSAVSAECCIKNTGTNGTLEIWIKIVAPRLFSE